MPWPVTLDRDELAAALVAVCDSPLGPLAPGATLRGIPLRDRLREMEFELPLAGGDVRGYPAAPVRLGDVAPLLRAHLPAGDPLLAYADALDQPALGGQSLSGYLTGSVDVVLRLPGEDGSTRYLVVDYKTNWLGGLPGEDGPTLSAHDYRPDVLAAAMGHSDYPLQALLYAVVLHRYLRWRQPGYDPAVHLGGVLYLYLRGMCGPGHPTGGRRAVRGVLVAAAGRAGRGAVRPARRSHPRGGCGMTELFEPTDAADRRLALGATGLLREFNDAGVLTAADVHVARQVGRLAGESDERVLLAAALAVRAVRHGSVCADLATRRARWLPSLAWPDHADWVAAVEQSPLLDRGRAAVGVRAALPRPLLAPGGPALRRPRRAHRPPGAGRRRDLARRRARPGLRRTDVRRAARRLPARPPPAGPRVLTGGPGTGKTTTVAGLLALLAEQAQRAGRPPLRIALTAPTGKAAARLQEAVASAAARLPEADRSRLGTLQAVTLHRLLGTRRDNGTRFRHHRGNRLPHDVVVVDESSMVSLTMMTRLVEAVRADARLVLVGDPDQLASVEAGAVLADLVSGLADRPSSPVVRLATTHRFGAEIGALAEAIRTGSADDVLEVLGRGGTSVEFVESDDPAALLRSRVVEAALDVRHHAEAGRPGDAVAALDRHRLLCAHRDGPYGVAHWNRQVEHWLSEATGDPLYEPMYVGRPLLVTANDYGLGVYNGDAGVVVRTDERTARLRLRGARARRLRDQPDERRRDDVRDHDPQEPGEPGGGGDRAAAAARLPAAHARALLHRRDPGRAEGARGRHRGRRARRRRATRPPGERAAPAAAALSRLSPAGSQARRARRARWRRRPRRPGQARGPAARR